MLQHVCCNKVKLVLTLAVLALLGTITLRTVLFPNYQHRVVACSPVEGVDYIELTEARLNRFREAIKLQTVSYSYHTTNVTALDLMLDLIQTNYPAIHTSEHVVKEQFNKSILFTIQGTDPAIKPVLLTGHLDVVPAETDKWSFPAFSGDVDQGVIYGRGTLDNKNTVFGILEALEVLVQSQERLTRTLYVAFGHDEEVMGLHGASVIADELEKRGLSFAFMVDEGMPVLKEGSFPGYNGPVGLVGVAEKGFTTLTLDVEHEGGHASCPPKETAIDILAEAIMKIRANPMSHLFGRGVEVQMFEHAATSLNLPMRVLASNLWLFGPVLGLNFMGKDTMRALITSTIAFTKINGGVKDNVLPNSAQLTVNSRLHPAHTNQDIIEHITKTINDPRIKITELYSNPASDISSAYSEGYNVLHHTIKEIFSEAIVLPGMLTGGTDTKWYGRLCDDVYRFAPSYITTLDIKRIHGHDEIITVKNYEQAINFYYHFMRNIDHSYNVQLHEEL